MTRAKRAWEEYAAGLTPDPEESARLAFTFPVLLRADVLEYLVTEENLAADERGQLTAAILGYVQEAMAERPEAYVIGVGPVEALWEQLESGERSKDQAVLAAKGLAVTETLTPAYVENLLSGLIQAAAKPPTWRQSRDRGEIVRAAVAACDRRDEPALRRAHCRGVVRWAHGLLMSVPDRALLAEADALGEEELAVVTAAGDQAGIADARFQLAALWTDPYCAGRSTTGYAQDDQAWQQRGYTELHERDGRAREDYAMPPATAALATAMTHWRAARDADPDNPATLAGLAETSMWQARVLRQENGAAADRNSPEPAPEEAVAAVKHGLELVAAHPDNPLRARLRMLASVLRVPVETTSELADADPDALSNQFGDEARQMVLQEIIGASVAEPKAALAMLDHHRELLLTPGGLGDSDFRVLCQTAARVLHRAIGAPGEVQPTSDKAFDQHAAEVLARLGPDAAPARQAATMVWLAYLSTSVDEEETGLALLRLVRQNAPLFARRMEWLLRAVEAELLTGVGVNAYRAHDYPAALRWYLAALGAWLQQERLEPVKDLLARLADIADGADDKTAIDIIAGLVSIAPAIATKLGGEADDQLFLVFSGVFSGLLESGAINSEILWTILEFGKGLRTAMLLDRTTAVRVRDDAEAVAILDRIAARPADADEPIALYHAFERQRQRLLLTGLTVPTLLDLDQTRRALDHRTVLLSTMTAFGRSGGAYRVAGIFWDDDQALVGAGPLPPDLPADEVPWLPEGVQQVLAERAAEGRDHLCIIADGGLHVAPWHLYSLDDDTMLADNWIVTLLPHPHLLFSGRGQLAVAGAADLPVLAVGIAQSTAVPGLPPLADAPQEAQAIANLLGGRALVDQQATEQAITELAPGARYLHIASHGRFDHTAPAFHAVIATPDQESDGLLCAWEVAELDLRSVRLVTLSACDTAEIAVTSGDNIDGLPVAFLAAGARAVVGTQWEIETTVSRRFFEEFYAALATTQDLRDAFRAAQVSIRRQFTEPREWAAFYLLGDWR
jgi:hypothetical protein